MVGKRNMCHTSAFVGGRRGVDVDLKYVHNPPHNSSSSSSSTALRSTCVRFFVVFDYLWELV